MLKETENEETRRFCHIFIIGGISILEGLGPLLPGNLHDCNFQCYLWYYDFACFFACLPLYACPSDTDGSVLYDHVKYVIFLVKIKINVK